MVSGLVPEAVAVKHVGKQLSWILLDLLLFALAALLSSLLLGRQPEIGGVAVLLIMAVVRLWFFTRSGMYRAVLRYSGLHTLSTLFLGTALGSAVGTVAGYFGYMDDIGGLGRAFLTLEGLLSLAFCGGSRFVVRAAYERGGGGEREKVLIYGAGSSGELALRSLRRDGLHRPIGFIDDDPARRGAMIHDLRVLGHFDELEEIVGRHGPQMLVITATLDQDRLRAVFRRCMALNLRIKIMREVLGGQVPRLEDLALEDLLRRPPRNLDPEPVRQMLADKRVLVTGAGGSIGGDLCRQIARLGVARLLLLDQSEAALYRIELELNEQHPELELRSVLLDCRDRDELARLLSDERPQVAFHAAAYKHVPMVEHNPFAAVANNVLGFRNLLELGDELGIERLLLISSDKAVRPSNVMGASKRVCELLLQQGGHAAMRCCAVRFGNVLGSSGSVVPLFLSQIARGGPVTVTHPEVTRYFMLIPEAVELVLHAATLAEERDVFLLDMGEPITIAHMARQLIFMTGNVPDRDIPIEYIGLRPGEKLFEELLTDDAEAQTAIDGVVRARTAAPDADRIAPAVDRLLTACRDGDRPALREALLELVPEWQPSELFSARAAPAP